MAEPKLKSRGDAGRSGKGPNLGRALGNRITLNLDAVDQVKRDHRLNPSEGAALDAGLVAHEGEHAGASMLLISLATMSGERKALFTESYTYQGLHTTDRVFMRWNESWANVDKHVRESERVKAIERNLNPKKPQDQQPED